MAMTAKVHIPKYMLFGIAVIAASASLGVVFLLGRASVRSVPMPLPTALDSTSEIPTLKTTNSDIASPPGTAIPDFQSGGQGTKMAQPSNNTIAQNNPERAAVTAYLKAVGSIQTDSSGNPEAVAQQIIEGLGKGDTSGIDGMILQAQESRGRLLAITPPQPCVTYHHELLATLNEGLDLMRVVKQMLTSANPSIQTTEIVNRANAMKSHSDSLQGQEKALKQRYSE